MVCILRRSAILLEPARGLGVQEPLGFPKLRSLQVRGHGGRLQGTRLQVRLQSTIGGQVYHGTGQRQLRTGPYIRPDIGFPCERNTSIRTR